MVLAKCININYLKINVYKERGLFLISDVNFFSFLFLFLDIKQDEISNWYGANKYEVLDHFLMRSNIVSSSQNKDKMKSVISS